MINSNIRNICYCGHENVNQKCLHCRFKVSKEKVSFPSENYQEVKKKINKGNEVLMNESYNDKIRFDIKVETQKYLKRIFDDENFTKNMITNKINNENKKVYFNFDIFIEMLKIILENEDINYVLKMYNNMYFNIKATNNLNQNIYINKDIFKNCNDKQKKEIIFLIDKSFKYLLNININNTILIYNQSKNLLYSLVAKIFYLPKLLPTNVNRYGKILNESLYFRKCNFKSLNNKKSIDSNIEPTEGLINTNDLLSIEETLCCHTKIKKIVIGGYQNTSFNDKHILIFGIENSNKSIFINQVFYYLYQWINKEIIDFFINKIYTFNECTEICIYEFNNTILPYKIALIDCPEYKINQQYTKQFTYKKFYKDFLRKYVTSNGYFVLSSVIIAVKKENDLINNKFQKQIKKLKQLFGKINNSYIFEECLNGKLKWYENENKFDIFNNISQYFKKLENNYKIVLKPP